MESAQSPHRKSLLRKAQSDLFSLPPLQLGLGFSQRSIQTAINAARIWARNLGKTVMIKVDIKNAFGTISRQAVMLGISDYSPKCLLNGPHAVCILLLYFVVISLLKSTPVFNKVIP